MPRIIRLREILLAGLLLFQGLTVTVAADQIIPILPRAAEKTVDDFAERRAEEIAVNPLTDELVSVRLTARGENREEALQRARERAVLAAAGRVLIDGRLTRADALLERYLRNYAANFINGIEVLSDTFTGGQVVLDCRVFVSSASLTTDLAEKRFLFTPAFKPMFNIYMEEELSGQRIDQEIAREILQAKLAQNDIKNYYGVVDNPKPTVDVKADNILEAAFVASERRNVEVMITGSTRTREVEGMESRRVYFDTFFFYESEMNVTVYRVDNKEELFSLTAKGAAAARDRADAIRMAIERAAEVIARQTNEMYRDQWRNVVRGGSNFEILLTGADEELINVVKLHLDRMGQNTQIFLKKKFDRSAVLSIVTDASRAELLEAIRTCPYPSLSVVREVSPRSIEVRISG
ncbi:MAG: hypothetical protein JJU11_00155 [Candidatus Sumerlaeia bacterium]|nr:hypothetical protein [Candidatus Sumerlaeia bacterium]